MPVTDQLLSAPPVAASHARTTNGAAAAADGAPETAPTTTAHSNTTLRTSICPKTIGRCNRRSGWNLNVVDRSAVRLRPTGRRRAASGLDGALQQLVGAAAPGGRHNRRLFGALL